MKTIISHFFNEEYLLPFWLKHHKKYFDHGIMINYGSYDNSIDIIKEICPTWEIIDTKNDWFESVAVDREVQLVENNLNGWRIALNVTEFLIGNYEILNNIDYHKQYIIGCHCMVDPLEKQNTDIKFDLINERRFGLNYKKFCRYPKNELFTRRARSLANYNVNYLEEVGRGRHYDCYKINTDDFSILYYGWSPYNKKLLKRRIQLYFKNSPYWHQMKYTPIWLPTIENYYKLIKEYDDAQMLVQNDIEDLSSEIDRFY